MKKQFIYPEILIHDMRRKDILTVSQDIYNKNTGGGDLAPTRGGGLPTAPEDQSGWQDLSGFQNGNSGW